MKIRMLQADTELVRVLDSISANPAQWDGWFCINIKDPDLEIMRIAKELIVQMERKLHDYLSGIDGWLFLGSYKEIFIFSKSITISQEVLARNISELINPGNAENLVVNTFDLTKENERFCMEVIKNCAAFNSFESIIRYYDRNKEINGTKEIKKPYVLLVEDDPTARWVLRKAIKNDCVLQTAQTTGEAFSAYDSAHPDIVLLDIGLPDGSGHAVLDWILRNDPGAYVVICSSKDDEDNRRRAFERGAKGFLGKPISYEQLRWHIDLCPKLH